MLEVKIKKLSDKAIIPTYAKSGDAGMDMYATKIVSSDEKQVVYGTDIALEIPDGYVGLVFPRSSVRKTDLILANSVGVIDSGYRGEVMVSFKQFGGKGYAVGERICQIMIVPYPTVKFVEVDELSDTERGTGGHGSTGV